MSRFIESIKIEDQEIFNINFHQKRVNDTFENFGKENLIDLEQIFKDLEHDEDGLYKLRIVYDLNSKFTVNIIPYAYSEIKEFALVENNTLDYSFKFEERKIFEMMKIKSRSEEIIIVKNNHITDSSYANLLFLKGKQWFTPNTCLLNGTQKQALLKSKKIKETEINLRNLKEFSHFQMINAMIGFEEIIYPIELINNLSHFSNDNE
ncbi:aminotransferase class IV [Halpernia frigidisoli]|uniref:4-amino-4-deoxychorismate lyase n=1 Tax=Halpernia frigidisoli TaxID=1125876 RepID=A0A1I3GI74_9FLAO|nr:aminotransferase class IV [Halpernia frigidisoli]SFI23215.1 4-amino-4-deoxychorismate lyase [Halpernia frigidisoli]